MKMTTLKEVEKALSEIKENKLASNWVANDIIKMKLAMGYDAWINDINDHQCILTLIEYIETCIDNPKYIGYNE